MKFFLSEDIVKKPFENASITVDRDVYLIILRYLFEAFVKVLHVLHQKRSRECEIFLLVLAVIYDMNHDLILEIVRTYVHHETVVTTSCAVSSLLD
jgi:hypothetical protein